ncbi:MAG: Ig-like domain-containing protein [Bacilli bacterium]
MENNKKQSKTKNLLIAIGISLLVIGITVFIILNMKDNKTKQLEISNIEIIEFTDNIISLKPNETYQLQLDILPINHKEETILYLVNDESIISIDKKGLVKGLKSGNAVITAITKSGKTANLEAVVETENSIIFEPTIPIKKIDIKDKKISLLTGNTYQIQYNILPNNATDKSIMWETTDARIATVTDKGLITARQVGKVVLTAYSSTISTSISLNVISAPVTLSDIELNPTNMSLSIGDTYQMKINFIPSNTNNKNVTWISSNNNIVTVDNGLLRAKNSGTVTITAISNNISKKSIINVKEKSQIIEITSLKLNQSNLEIKTNEQVQLSLTYLPKNATNNKFIWTTSNGQIVTVTNTGLIKGIKEGKTTIYVKSTNGRSSSIEITVKNEKPESDSDGTIKPLEVLLNFETLLLENGQQKKMRATVLPLNADQKVTWFTGADSIISIDSNGLITAKKTGKTTVSAFTSNGLIAKAMVTVRYPIISPSTASQISAPGSSISSAEISRINDHLANYIEESGEIAKANGQSVNRAKVISAAYFLAYNPYYKISYNFSGKDSIGNGWFKNWGNKTNNPQYPVKGIDCNAFIRWAFYQVYNKDISTIGGEMRIRANAGLKTSDVAAVAQPGDVLRKDKELMGGASGHVAFVYSVDRANGTFSVIHAGGSRIGVAITNYDHSSSRINYNYLYSMSSIYKD